METTEATRVGYVETGGRYGRTKVEIFLTSDHREHTEEEKWEFLRSAERLANMFNQNSYAMDEEAKRRGGEETALLKGLFDGLAPVYFRAIPNEYYQQDVHTPWLMATTPRGHFKVGWRKRVIVVDWNDTDIKADADSIFPNEDVTKDGRMIHAWGYEKAREYLLKLDEAASGNGK